eukprot:COSAG04_NODE_6049_length_1422_cov_0.900983_2_plen_201_part_00
MSFQTSWLLAYVVCCLTPRCARCRRVLELVGHHGGDIRGLTLTFQRDSEPEPQRRLHLEAEAEPEPEPEPAPDTCTDKQTLVEVAALLSSKSQHAAAAKEVLGSALTTMDEHLAAAASQGGARAVRRWIAEGASPDAKHGDGWPAVVLAAIRGRLAMLKVLHQHGAKLEATEPEFGWTALVAALLGTRGGSHRGTSWRRG